MPISLHAALVPTWVQMLHGLSDVLDKAADFCAEADRAEGDLAQCKLAPDMFDFAYQVKSAKVHSLGAVEGARAGVFSPDWSEPPSDIEGMKALISQAISGLEAIDPEELEGFIGKDMEFRWKDFVLPFEAQDFLLSFSQPNFFFHVTTAYAILRGEGAKIGKMNYMGPMRVRS